MPARKAPQERAVNALWVTDATRKRVLDLRIIGDTHENVVVRLLDFYEKRTARGQSSKTNPAANKLGVSNEQKEFSEKD